jgi:Arc/MetJ family transcription regulator
MRVTLNIPDDLMKDASNLTGIKQKTALIHAALQLLIQKEAGRRLAALGGTMPGIGAFKRKRAKW